MEDEKYLKRQRFYKIVMLVVLTAFLTFIFTPQEYYDILYQTIF